MLNNVKSEKFTLVFLRDHLVFTSCMTAERTELADTENEEPSSSNSPGIVLFHPHLGDHNAIDFKPLYRAANNNWSSDIGQPKFAHVRRNPKCGQTWCPDNFLIVNNFTAKINKIQPFVFGDVRPQFCFVRPRWCLSRTYVLSSEKNYLQPCFTETYQTPWPGQNAV